MAQAWAPGVQLPRRLLPCKVPQIGYAHVLLPPSGCAQLDAGWELALALAWAQGVRLPRWLLACKSAPDRPCFMCICHLLAAPIRTLDTQGG